MAADVTTIQPTQANHRTGPILCVDDFHRQYFVDRLSIQPIVDIHTSNNQSVYRGVLKKVSVKDKQDYYFVYTARHKGLNEAKSVHVTLNASHIPCKNIVPVGKTTSKLELDNNNWKTLDDFLSRHGDIISNIPIDVINDSTSNTETGCIRKIRGQMKDDDLCVILPKYSSLLNTIEHQHVQPFLIEHYILDLDDIDRLQRASNVSRRKATEELLHIIRYESGSDVFPIFVECLYKAGYEHFAKELQPSLYV